MFALMADRSGESPTDLSLGRHTLLVAVLFSVLIGCAEAPTQTYQGARLPAGQVAIVQGHSGLLGSELQNVDGKDIDSDWAEVLPGMHDATFHQVGCTCKVSFSASAGHVYELSASCSDKKSWITDFADGKLIAKNDASGACD